MPKSKKRRTLYRQSALQSPGLLCNPSIYSFSCCWLHQLEQKHPLVSTAPGKALPIVSGHYTCSGGGVGGYKGNGSCPFRDGGLEMARIQLLIFNCNCKGVNLGILL
ncbi:hypothetical protein Dimus_027176 [Dionaea muscipula]